MNAPHNKKASATDQGTWKPGDPIVSPVESTIEIDPRSVSQKDMYKLLIGAVVPRPIAFVSTRGKEGTTNIAPFSFFNGVSSSPACVMFCVGFGAKDQPKDTLRNIEETGEFIVNSANKWLIEPLVHTAANYAYGVDEMKKVGLTPIEGSKVAVPRVKEAAVSFECNVYKLVEIGDRSPGSSVMVIGEIVCAHIDERCYSNGRIDFDTYQAVGRLGDFAYGDIETQYDIPVPRVEE